MRDHPKLAIAVATFVLVVGQLHVGFWTTVYLGFALVAGCCVSAFAVIGGTRPDPPHTGR